MALPTAVGFARQGSLLSVQGVSSIGPATSGSVAVLTSTGANTAIAFQTAQVNVTSASAGTIISLNDGATGVPFFEATAVGCYPVNFGENGIRLTTDTGLFLKVSSAEATVSVTAKGFKVV